MDLKNPIAVYNARTNLEAHVITMFLIEAGIDAQATEDHSLVGLWMFGTLPEIHKPQVWVSGADAERARQLLVEHEDRLAERLQGESEGASTAPIDIVCEECQQATSFPPALRGTIQDCPHCGAYVDVEPSDGDDEFWHESDESNGR